MEHVYHIRYEYYENEKSIREIARLTGHDRETVAKYISKENFNLPKPIKCKRKSKTDKYRDQVREWLIADEKAPRKQRHTAKRVYDRLNEQERNANEDFDVSERAIRSLVAELKRELNQQEVASLPLLHPAGEAQVDFGETHFNEKDIYYEGNHLTMTFPHSDTKYVQLFKGQIFECLAQGLTNIFYHIGYVPDVIRFDNMSTAVKAIKAQGEREVTDNFRRLQCHYGFQSNFCNPESGHEKGSVENYVGYSRRNYFVPVPKMDDLEEYNRNLLKQCDKDLDREHYKHQQQVRQLFEEDKSAMKPLPRYAFEACRYVIAKTDQYAMAKVLQNKYSTAGDLARQEVTLKLDAYQVTVLDDRMQPVVTHKRLYGKNKESMIWGPYLDVLAKRPMALKYSGFFEGLPDPVRHFLDGCSLEDKKQVMGVVAQICREKGMDKSVKALMDAVNMNPKDADTLITAYAFVLNKPGQLPKNDVPEYIPKLKDYVLDFADYAKLMGGPECSNN
ncbi:MAG TPA: IS21 family transposase [Clostridia bacterium]|nr:IS21 family transposase [Clostridia bacterium]HPQ46420.1 IS21 family transposase [Clostridia bacterium]HRX42042.1 IS21 family transposase [Clostridia bacterium]